MGPILSQILDRGLLKITLKILVCTHFNSEETTALLKTVKTLHYTHKRFYTPGVWIMVNSQPTLVFYGKPFAKTVPRDSANTNFLNKFKDVLIGFLSYKRMKCLLLNIWNIFMKKEQQWKTLQICSEKLRWYRVRVRYCFGKQFAIEYGRRFIWIWRGTHVSKHKD